jgi:phytoene synthase
MLLPTRFREPATALYAFCRLADDAVDLEPTSGAAAIERLRERLASIYAGRPSPSAADRAFCATIESFGIPRALPEGFAWDVEHRRYETIDDLNAYGARVAGSVGAMMSLVMGHRHAGTVARACQLGMAMQLSNIARDVGEDARAGRLYLPREWLSEAGIDPGAWMSAPVFSSALGEVVRKLLGAAEQLYVCASVGIDELPFLCRPAIRASRFLYADIGRQVEANGYDSISRRAVVPPLRKMQVIARSLLPQVHSSPALRSPGPAQARFMIDEIARTPAPERSDGPIAWLVELFGRLERQDRLRQGRLQVALPAQSRGHGHLLRAGRFRKLEC